MPDLRTLEGISDYRESLREVDPTVPVCMMPSTLGALLDVLLAALPPPKHHIPTVPVGKRIGSKRAQEAPQALPEPVRLQGATPKRKRRKRKHRANLTP